jgi:hypothetical protein
MTWRTPPSLKWLIVKRSRISGRIEKLTEEQDSLVARLDHLNGLIPRLRGQVRALDETFGLHDIQVEPTEIAPVTPHQGAMVLPFGQMSRILLGTMRKHGTWVPTTVLTYEVLSRVPDGAPPHDEKYVRRAVRRRLGTLLREGRVERLLDNPLSHDGSTEALWRIPRDADSP